MKILLVKVETFQAFLPTIYLICSLDQWSQVEGAWNHNRRGDTKKEKFTLASLVSPDLLTKIETNKFMLYAYEKMGSVKCVTFIWDNALSRIVESMSGCPMEVPACSAYKYEINFEEGNMSSDIMSTLSAGYRSQCGAYVILLKSPRTVTNLLHQGDDLKLINTRARYLIWYTENDKTFEADDIWRKISNVILVHSKAKKIESIGGGSRVLFTVRGIRWPVVQDTTETTRTRVIEFWNYNGTETVGSDQEWFFDKTTDWKKSTIKILVVDHPSGVLKSYSEDGEVEYAGTEIEIVKALSVIMNFKYEFVDADPLTKWGGMEEVNSTSTFFGAVGRLIYGETDMAVGSFYILKHYLDYMDMSIPLDVVCTSFLTPNPKPRKRILTLLLPFRWELWILVLVTCFVLGPLTLFGLTHLGGVKYIEYAVFTRRVHTVLTSFRIMSQVALHHWPKTWPIRAFIGWYWLFWLCVTICYRSTMMSFLTIPLFERPIDNLNDLVKSNLRIGGWGTELQRLFSGRESFVDNEDQDTLADKYEILDDLDTGISLVAEGNFALFENLRFLRFIRMTRNLTRVGSPSMRIMKQCVVPVHIGFAYQKNSAITLTVNRFIRGFQEFGLIKKWGQRVISVAKEYDRRNLEDSDSEVDAEKGAENAEETDDTPSTPKSREPKVLALEDLQGTFYLMLLGLGLSTVAFVAELTLSRWHFLHDDSKYKDLKKLTIQAQIVVKSPVKALKLDVRMRKKKENKKVLKQPPFPYIE